MIKVNKNHIALQGSDDEIMAEFALLIRALRDSGKTEKDIRFGVKLGLSNIGNNGKFPANEVKDLLNMIDPKLGEMFRKNFK